MNAADAFNLNVLGRTTIEDGRKVVVYSDGRYTHAVLASHFDRCGFAATGDDEERNHNYAAWNRATDNWVDDLTAIEAAWRLGVFTIHSASGCDAMDASDHGACRAFASYHRGEHYTCPGFARDSVRVFWDGVWPVVDGSGDLTGGICEGGDGFYNVNDMAMISHDDARDGGWTVDDDGAYAEPPHVSPPDHPRWITTAEQADLFLATHRSVVLDYCRTRSGWVAVIRGSNVRPLPHSPMKLRDLERTLVSRYLAEPYGVGVTVYLDWARRMPNWIDNGGLGALPELARAIEQAERDRARDLART